jgi:hypothetical protein
VRGNEKPITTTFDEPVRDELVAGILLRELLRHGIGVAFMPEGKHIRGIITADGQSHHLKETSVLAILGKAAEMLTVREQ